jgi:hypothetical protein
MTAEEPVMLTRTVLGLLACGCADGKVVLAP